MSGVCKECNRLVEPASKPRWEHYEDKLKLIEYIKLHIISLEQDLETYYSEDDGGYLQTEASIETAHHLLSVANDILLQTKEN